MLPKNKPNLNACALTWAEETRVFLASKYQDEYETKIRFIELKGKVFRSPSGQALEMKNTGQRSFNNEKIITDTRINLNIDAVIYFENNDEKQFRVINKFDWSEFGFIEYDIVSDYE